MSQSNSCIVGNFSVFKVWKMQSLTNFNCVKCFLDSLPDFCPSTRQVQAGMFNFNCAYALVQYNAQLVKFGKFECW